MVDRRVLVGPPKFLEPITIVLSQLREGLIGLPRRNTSSVDDHFVGGHADDLSTSFRCDDGTRVSGYLELEAGPHERRIGKQKWHRLPLHVRAHECAVGVIVFEERNQRCRHRYELVRRHVHVVDVVRLEQREVTPLPTQHELVDEITLAIQGSIGLSNPGLFLFVGREPIDFVRDLLFDHSPVRRLDEAEFVDSAVRRERRDQADVRALRCLDGTHAPVVGVVYVPHLEPGTFPCQTPGTQGRETPLVRHFGQRVRLVHELAELRRTEERLDDRRNCAGIHEVIDVDLLWIRVDRHALFDQPCHPGQSNRELVGDEFAHGADTPISEMVDIVRRATPLAQFHEVAEDLDKVFLGEDRLMRWDVQTQPLVDLVAAHTA